MLNSPQLVDHSFFQPEPLLSWKGVSLGEGRSIFLDETGSTGSPAPDFSFARWVMGQSLPGLAKSKGHNKKLAGPQPTSGEQTVGMSVYTHNRKWKADKTESS